MFQSIRRRLSDFFMAEEVPYGLALCRIVLGIAVFIAMAARSMHVRELFTTDGAPTPFWELYQRPAFLPIPSPAVGVACYALLLLTLITSTLGWRTRTSLAISAALLLWFGILDTISTMTKHTVISIHAITLLALSQSGAVWSIDSWLEQRRSHGLWSPPTAPIWPRRLIQLLVGVVYLGAAATKMHTPSYFSGDQLSYWMLSNVNFANPLGEYLSLFPGILVVMAYITIFWEIVFAFVCWKGVGRTIALSLGVVFHIMTYFTLGLIVFPIVYLALYACFFDQADYVAWRRFERRHPWTGWWRHAWLAAVEPLKRLVPAHWSQPHSLAAWGVLIAAVCLVAVPVEQKRDVYGERRPEGRYQLTAIPEERVDHLLRTDERLRTIDKVFSFDIGSRTFDNVLIDQRRIFHYGDRAVVQCSLVPAHEDLWVEVILEDAENRIVHRTGSVIAREQLRGFHAFDFGQELVPGDYTFRMRIDGKTVASRSVQLHERN